MDLLNHPHQHGKSTLSKTAYLTLREAIINNQFKSGEILSENMLAEMLKMSRTPVREALKELKSDDLVQLIPGTGVLVKGLSEKELREVFDVRSALECLAVQTATEYFDPSELEDLITKWTKLQSELGDSTTNDWKNINPLDFALHRLLVHKSHNSCLIQLYEILLPKLTRYQSLVVKSWGNSQNTVQQHLDILDSIKEKDIPKLTDLLQMHFRTGLDVILRKL